MQAIKDSLIQRIYKSKKLSKRAITLLLDIIALADENGDVIIFYKDYIDNFKNGSYSQFYNLLKVLIEEYFISVKSKNGEKYIHINNVFNSKEEFQNYCDTNTVWFTNREYANLKAGEIRAYLYAFFKICKNRESRVSFKNNTVYHYVAKNIGVTERVAKDYCKELHKRDFISEKNNKDNKQEKNKWNFLTLKRKWLETPMVTQTTENGKRNTIKAHKMFFSDNNFIKKLCRKHNIIYNNNELNDTTQLINQYRKNSKVISKFGNVRRMIITVFKNVSDTLNPVSFHSIIKSLINMDYNNSISSFIKV